MPSDIPDTAKIDSTAVDIDAKGNVDSKSDNVTQVTNKQEKKKQEQKSAVLKMLS